MNKYSLSSLQFPVCSGGILIKVISKSIQQVLLCQKNNPLVISLPKGHPNLKETLFETAIREVREETGYDPQIHSFIERINYSFYDSKTTHINYKTVYFFLMTPKTNIPHSHDKEFDKIFWIDIIEATKLLSHDNEILIINRTIAKLKQCQLAPIQ